MLAAPIALTQLGSLLLSAVDTAVVGRLGETALGATGLGGSLCFAVSVSGWGWMLALDPLIAQAIGANEPERAEHLLRQGAWLALIGTAPLCLLVVALGQLLERFGIEAAVAA